MIIRACAVAAVLLTAASGSAQPPEPLDCPPVRILRPSAGEVRRYSADAQAAHDEATLSIETTLDSVASRLSRKTVFAGIIQDEYGDPMYAYYGPRAYAGTPCYAGPAYDASFERPTGFYYQGNPDSTALRVPGYRPAMAHPAGSVTQAGASQSYLQSGMMRSPGSMAPSGDRPASFNH